MEWAIAIFSARESLETLSGTISAAVDGAKGRAAVIDVLVNGNPALATDCGRLTLSEDFRGSQVAIRVWSIAMGDKSHAWNEYIYRIWPGSDFTFFTDGYARVKSDAFDLIARGLAASPHCLIGSGAPTMGRSAKRLREARGIQGNLYAMRGGVLRQLRLLNFRLPLGLYRTDPLLGALVCFNLNPAENSWDPSRILIEPDATWVFRPLHWWSPADLRTHANRMMRQAQGVLENLALHEYMAIQRKPPQSLPKTAKDLVISWIEASPKAATRTYLRSPLTLFAARKLRHAKRDWGNAEVPPTLVAETPAANRFQLDREAEARSPGFEASRSQASRAGRLLYPAEPGNSRNSNGFCQTLARPPSWSSDWAGTDRRAVLSLPPPTRH